MIESWRASGDGVLVDTTSGTLEADRLVVCAGPWASDLLGDLALPLVIERHLQVWLRPSRRPSRV